MGRPSRTAEDRLLMAAIGTRLFWVRKALGLSQQAIADRLGIHQTLWSLYERGRRMPDQFAAARLIAKLKISQAYLLDGSLDGVERTLAIRLAADHPELAGPIDKGQHTDTRPV